MNQLSLKFPTEVPLCGFHAYHMVKITPLGMLWLESHEGKSVTQLLGRDSTQGRSIMLVQGAEHFESREPLAFLTRLRATIEA